MAQNIYDNPEFFEAFRQLKKNGAKIGQIGGSMSVDFLAGVLPPLSGTAVLDLGCGDGWFSRWALEQGATSTHGIDVSESQLGLAKESTEAMGASDRAIWDRADLDTVVLKENAYDLVFSSLAIHYLKDLNGVLKKIAASLKPGGSVYFSVEHPLYTAPHRRETCKGPDGTWLPHWPVTQYWEEGDRLHFWLGKDVEKSHFTIQTYVNSVLGAGLALTYFYEWTRPNDGVYAGQAWWMASNIGPSFLMLGGKRL